MDFSIQQVEYVALGLELLGVSVIVIGVLTAIIKTGTYFFKSNKTEDGQYYLFRKLLGRGILLGLEFLVAGDIIKTVAVKLTMDSVLTLGIIVLIRTFLSFTLEVEMEGKWPWQHNK